MGRYRTLIVLAALFSCARVEVPPPSRSAVAALRGATGELVGFSRAEVPMPFLFPADQGPHHDFAIEWWYFTGNLEDEQGERFGYQLTFFRSALAPPGPPRASAWASRQIYLAHFALTDVQGARFAASERISRGAAGLAGARVEPFDVWVLDWRALGSGPPSPAAGIFPIHLEARAEDDDGRAFAIDLDLEAGKPRVLHGDDGLSRKGSAPGNASYYISRTRMPTRGTVATARGSHQVEGTSWLDREWSTSVLEANQVGWDWFSLQLDDGREVMVFELRRSGGGIDPASHGTLIEADGRSRHLAAEAFELTVLGSWLSPRGARYPARWHLDIEAADVEVIIEPWLANQELDLSFRYYEGAVRLSSAGGEPLGHGYVELVGYAETSLE